MIKFDSDLLSIEVVQLKTVTTSLGGAISIVDNDRTTEEEEVYTRIRVPMAVARQFREHHKISTYIHPVWTAVVYYDTHIIALERHPLGAAGAATIKDDKGNVRMWIPKCQEYIEEYVVAIINQSPRDWYFDGRYVYSFRAADAAAAILHSEFLTHDGRFRSIDVDAIALHNAHDIAKMQVHDRTCVAFIAGNGQYAVTPPIWKDVTSVGKKKVEDETDEVHPTFVFDNISDHLKVNLNFILRAAKDLSQIWGYQVIEVLDLPQLMLALKTVNLPSVPKAVKSTFDCGMSFDQSFAWLMGYMQKANTIEELFVVRGLLKYLTSKSLFFGKLFRHEAVYQAGMGDDDVPLLSRTEAIHNAKSMSPAQMLRRLEMGRRIRDTGRTVETAMGSIMTGDE